MLSRRMGFGPVVLSCTAPAVGGILHLASGVLPAQKRPGIARRAKCQATHIDCQRNDDQNIVDGKVSEQFNPPGSNWFTHVTMNGTLCADMGPVSISTP